MASTGNYISHES